MIETVFVVAAVAAGLALAACGFLLWQQRAHYEALLADARADNKDLRDRLFLSRGLAPSGVDEQRRFEQKRAEADERRKNGGEKPAQIGPLASAQAAMEKSRADGKTG